MGIEMLGRFFEQVRGMQQSLGRNAAYVQAGTAKRATFFNAGNFKAKLCGADGANITARTATDHDNVVVLTHEFCDPFV